MKKFRTFSAIICALICAAFPLLPACGYTSVSVYDAFYFDAPVKAEAYGKEISEETKDSVDALLNSLDETFSAENGIMSAINAAEAGERVRVNADFVYVLEKARTCYGFSDGKFDPTVFPLVKLWGFYPDYPVENFTLPDAEDLAAARAKTGFNQILTEKADENYYVYKTRSDVAADLGGAAKGYAADKIAEILSDAGIKKGYVSIGGSSIRILSVNELYVRHPEKSGEYLLKINCKNLAGVSVSTSGTYERYYDVDGTRYSHIINPYTGFPSDTGVISVTVICGDGASADCLTTALCLCSHDFGSPDDPEKSELVSYVKKVGQNPDYENCLIFAAAVSGGTKHLVTNAGENSFSLVDADYRIIKV